MKEVLICLGAILVFIIYRIFVIKNNSECSYREPLLDVTFVKANDKHIICPNCRSTDSYYDNLKEKNVCMDCKHQWS